MEITADKIEDVLKQIVPEPEALQIVNYLVGKTNISEFIIAEELDLEIHRTRNLLYKLLDQNVVTFKRKKDKIKGWYICYWDFNDLAILRLEEKLRLETLDRLKERLSNEDGGFFYMCRFAHARLGFDEAFEYDFKCPECGELMNQQDNARTVDFLKNRISELEVQQEQFEKEMAKSIKAKQKEMAKATS